MCKNVNFWALPRILARAQEAPFLTIISGDSFLAYYYGLRTAALIGGYINIIRFNKVVGKEDKAVLR